MKSFLHSSALYWAARSVMARRMAVLMILFMMFRVLSDWVTYEDWLLATAYARLRLTIQCVGLTEETECRSTPPCTLYTCYGQYATLTYTTQLIGEYDPRVRFYQICLPGPLNVGFPTFERIFVIHRTLSEPLVPVNLRTNFVMLGKFYYWTDDEETHLMNSSEYNVYCTPTFQFVQLKTNIHWTSDSSSKASFFTSSVVLLNPSNSISDADCLRNSLN